MKRLLQYFLILMFIAVVAPFGGELMLAVAYTLLVCGVWVRILTTARNTDSARNRSGLLFFGAPILATVPYVLFRFLYEMCFGITPDWNMAYCWMACTGSFWLCAAMVGVPLSRSGAIALCAPYAILTLIVCYFAMVGFGESSGNESALATPTPIFAGGFALVMFAVLSYLPWHRRYWHLTAPSPLPHVPRRTTNVRGLTLIEMLVVIAMIAITTAGMTHLFSQNARLHEYATRRHAATQAAEEQLDLLRVRGVAPQQANGVQGMDATILARYGNRIAAANADEPMQGPHFEISAGPDERVRQVAVHIPIHAMDGAMITSVTLTTFVQVKESN